MTTLPTPELFSPVEEPTLFKAAGVDVHGTLTRPDKEGRYPAVLIIAGSGPTDRNWNSPMLPGTNGSAMLLAARLAERGIVSLRYDKRGTGKTALSAEPLTWEHYLAEQRAGLRYLAAASHVDPGSIFVAGHSEGGAHALKLMSAPGVPLRGVLLLMTAGRSLRTVVVGQVRANLAQNNVPGVDEHCQKLDEALGEIVAGRKVDPTQVSPFPGLQQLVMAFQNPASGDFPQELLAFDPKEALRKITLPVLLLGGGKDIQIDDELDVKALYTVALEAGLGEVELTIAEDADHVLKHEPTPKNAIESGVVAVRYNAEDRVLDRVVLERVVGWIVKHSGAVEE